MHVCTIFAQSGAENRKWIRGAMVITGRTSHRCCVCPHRGPAGLIWGLSALPPPFRDMGQDVLDPKQGQLSLQAPCPDQAPAPPSFWRWCWMDTTSLGGEQCLEAHPSLGWHLASSRCLFLSRVGRAGPAMLVLGRLLLAQPPPVCPAGAGGFSFLPCPAPPRASARRGAMSIPGTRGIPQPAHA